MWIGVLGGTEASRADGTPVTLGGPRARALLALLAADAGRVVGTARLAEGIYGDEAPDGVANAIQSQVSRLRQALRGTGVAIEFDGSGGTGYRLAIEPDRVDAHRFERLAARGRRALTEGAPAEAAGLLREALALWRGPAFGDVPEGDRLGLRLTELRLDTDEDRIEAELALGRGAELVPELRELAAAHPLRERVHTLLVRALHAAGRTAEALTAFAQARTVLAEELGADPSAELSRAHLAVLRGQDAPERGSALPAQLTGFLGRDEELRRLDGLLTGHRLVTLTGPGGAGKTRLALEAAGRAGGEVCFTELAPLTGDAELAGAVLTALRVTGTGRAGGLERLVAALEDRPVLLVLDNCEHVIARAAELTAALLAACPGLRVLATSREPLGITGETLCPVPGFGVPAPGTGATVALEYPVVRLFAERAAAVRPDFAVDEATVADVLRICAALDGLPLAVELAAARVRTLPTAELAARLDDRFSLLSKGSRTAAARHRTLHAVVEWSWELLSEPERELAARLSVFAGDAALDSIRRVCAAPGVDVPEELSGLVDKSLVETGGGRYRMLETIRVFCAGRLAGSGELERLRRAHAEHFLELAGTADGHLLAAEQLEWLARLDAEHDNLLAALDWAIEHDVPLALRLVACLSAYWWMRGRQFEAAAFSRALAGKLEPEPPPGLHEEYLLCLLGTRYREAGDLALLETVARYARDWHSAPRRPVLHLLIATAVGPPSSAGPVQVWHDQRMLGADPWSRALASAGAGMIAVFRGDLAGAEGKLTTGLTGFRALGERWGTVTALSTLAQLAHWRGEQEQALGMIAEALELAGQLGAADEYADLLCLRARCLLFAGDRDGAGAALAGAVEAARRGGVRDRLADAYLGQAEVARLGGQTALAGTLCARALETCPDTGFVAESIRAQITVTLARLAVTEGRRAEALAWLAAALDTAREREHNVLGALALEALAGLACADGDGERAATLLGAAVSLRGTAVAGDPDVAAASAAATALLGADRFSLAYRRGAATTAHEALAITG